MSYGGGFLASQGDGSSPSGGKKSGSQALRPVTINQVANAHQSFNDADFLIDDLEVKEITLVACIRSVNKTTTQATFLIEDGTGQIDCRMWIESTDPSDDDDPRLRALEINHYVRIIGSIKTFAEKRHINAQRVRAIEDFNEINFHLVECAYVHKYITQGPPGGGGSAMVTDRPYDNAANPYASDTKAGGDTDMTIPSDLPQGQREVLKYLRQKDVQERAGEDGTHYSAIARHLKVSDEKARVMLESMKDEGYVYTAFDDDHFLST